MSEFLPCDNCGKLIPADVHSEELGFCLPCSNKFWSHKSMGGGDCEHLILLETGDKFMRGLSDFVPVACVECKAAWDEEVY
jgi:hypothetical protein